MLMARALKRHQSGNARIIPLLLRPVAWRESPLAAFSCIPFNYRPVTEWANQDAAFDECVRATRRLIGRPTTSTLGSGSLGMITLVKTDILQASRRAVPFQQIIIPKLQRTRIGRPCCGRYAPSGLRAC